MTAKRMEKLNPLKERRDLFTVEGDKDAPLALVSWGSVAGAAREALELVRGKGLPVKLLVPKLMFPIAENVYREFFASVHAGLVVEQSYQGQLRQVLRMYVDVPAGIESFAKTSANPILAIEVAQRLEAIAARCGIKPAVTAARTA